MEESAKTANCFAYCDTNWPENSQTEKGRVFILLSVMYVIAMMNSFQHGKKVMIATVDIADFDIGAMMRNMTLYVPHPSMIADSSSALGMVSRKPVMIKIAIGRLNAVYGRIKAQ